jgi:translation elongation factor EF-Ts
MDPKKKVSDVLKENSSSKPIQVVDFIRYKVGEGV